MGCGVWEVWEGMRNWEHVKLERRMGMEMRKGWDVGIMVLICD